MFCRIFFLDRPAPDCAACGWQGGALLQGVRAHQGSAHHLRRAQGGLHNCTSSLALQHQPAGEAGDRHLQLCNLRDPLTAEQQGVPGEVPLAPHGILVVPDIARGVELPRWADGAAGHCDGVQTLMPLLGWCGRASQHPLRPRQPPQLHDHKGADGEVGPVVRVVVGLLDQHHMTPGEGQPCGQPITSTRL